MKTGVFQLNDKCLPAPFDQETLNNLKEFKPHQLIRMKMYGIKKPRSVQQNKWAHNMFQIVSENTDDVEWNTLDKTKRMVKLAMKFFKDDVAVIDNKVYFELRSFAFDKMPQPEADKVFNEALEVCSEKSGIPVEELMPRIKQ